jgi:hypothetical protein
MRLRPRNVRSRLTVWYVLVLACLLALYAGIAYLFLLLSLREEFDRNLVKDVEIGTTAKSKSPQLRYSRAVLLSRGSGIVSPLTGFHHYSFFTP